LWPGQAGRQSCSSLPNLGANALRTECHRGKNRHVIPDLTVHAVKYNVQLNLK
jgi:hypothetical protein